MFQTTFQTIIHYLHQFPFMAALLFIVAVLIIVSSTNSQKSAARYAGYVIAVALIASIFIIF